MSGFHRWNAIFVSSCQSVATSHVEVFKQKPRAKSSAKRGDSVQKQYETIASDEGSAQPAVDFAFKVF